MTPAPRIDHAKCTLCAKCVEICPRKVLAVEEKQVQAVSDTCILCSHCYTVCKFNAVSFDSLRDLTFRSFKPVRSMFKSGDVDPATLVNCLRSRRSVRKYKDKPVPDAILKDLVEFAVSAPSGSNRQDWEFVVLNDRKKVRDLAGQIGMFFRKVNALVRNPFSRYLSVFFAGMTLINYWKERFETVEMALREAEKGIDLLFWGAPACIIVHGPPSGSTPVEDAQFASYNMVILAHALGLGSCYIGYAVNAINRAPVIKKYLGIPVKNRVHDVLVLGYPAAEYYHPSLRKNYKCSWL